MESIKSFKTEWRKNKLINQLNDWQNKIHFQSWTYLIIANDNFQSKFMATYKKKQQLEENENETIHNRSKKWKSRTDRENRESARNKNVSTDRTN